nr:monocarboxylate transporter 2-like [Procambarus clarkii]
MGTDYNISEVMGTDYNIRGVIETDYNNGVVGHELHAGRYAWLVAGMVFSVNLVTAGYVKSFGILYILVLDYFPDISGAAAGWVVGLLVGCRGLLSPVMGALTVAVGPRVCVLAGTLLAAGGLLLAVPAFSIFYMAFTLGGLVGTGLCMSETPGFLTVTDYFQEKRALANGLRAAGNPMGGILFPPLVVFLHHHFGLRGTFMMLAGIMLQMLVFGLLMRPFELHKTIIYEKYKRQIKKNLQRGDVDNTEATAARLKVLESGSKKKPLDFTVFKNPAYVMYLVMGMFANAAMPNALFYSPVYGKSIGLSPYENSIVASYVSGCDFCIRLLCGWITNMNLFKTRYAFIAGLMSGGAGCLLVPLCSRLWHLMAASTLHAFCMASFWTLISVLLADQFGPDAMASTWGFFRMTQGVCSFFYPTIIGMLLDVSGGMVVPYLVMGSMLLLAASVMMLQPLVARLPGSKINLD